MENIKNIIKDTLLLEAKKKKARKTKLTIVIDVPTKITVYSSKHNDYQMCCRPDCVKRPNYVGCYDAQYGEQKIPIKFNTLVSFVKKQKNRIINYIQKGSFKTFKQKDKDQFLALLSYSDEISKIYTTSSLTYLGPFDYMVRAESSRRYSGRRFPQKLIINEDFKGEETTKLISDFGTVDIKTKFNVTISGMVKNKIEEGFDILDYKLDDVVTLTEEYLLELLKGSLPNMINNINRGKMLYVTENDLGIEYNITHSNISNITNYELVIHDINM